MLTDTKAARQFVPFIHLLRGIAPLLVMWSHLVGMWLYVSSERWALWTVFYNNVMLPFHVYQGGGHLGVILFFLISGYVISMVGERETRLEFVIKRLFRIIPPLFIATCVFGLLNSALLFWGYAMIPGTLSHELSDYILAGLLLDHFVYLKNNVMAVTWTLVSEFWFYGIFLIVLPYVRSQPFKTTFIMLGLYALVSAPTVVSPYFAYAGQFNVYIPIFIIGRLAYLSHNNRLPIPQSIWLAAASLTIFVMVHEARFPGLLWAGPIIKAFTYPIAILIFVGAMWLPAIALPRIVGFFGDISYSLYLLHMPIGMAAIIVFNPIVGFTAALAVAVVLTIFCSWLSFTYVEKPCQRAARAIYRAMVRDREQKAY